MAPSSRPASRTQIVQSHKGPVQNARIEFALIDRGRFALQPSSAIHRGLRRPDRILDREYYILRQLAELADEQVLTLGNDRRPVALAARGRNWLVMKGIMQGMQIADSGSRAASASMPQVAEHFGHDLAAGAGGHRFFTKLPG